MKNLTKTEVKKQVTKILNETVSKVIKLVRKNGYEIAYSSLWNTYTKNDFEKYDTGMDILKTEAELFEQENLEALGDIVYNLESNSLELVSKTDIEKFCNEYKSARKNYFAEKNEMNAKKKTDRATKIAKLRKQLAKLKAEEDA